MQEQHTGDTSAAGQTPEECEREIATLLRDTPSITKGALESLGTLDPCDKLRLLKMMRTTLFPRTAIGLVRDT